MPDTLILSNAASSMGPSPAQVHDEPSPWAMLAPGVYLHADAYACVESPTIEIIGVADAHVAKVHFLLQP